MSVSINRKRMWIFCITIFICAVCTANENLFKEAKALQCSGNLDEAARVYKEYLSRPVGDDELTGKSLAMYTDALMQLMNTYQRKGEPEECISVLQEIYEKSPILQNQCRRDFYSVMGYAKSRTENVKEAEELMFKALTLPLYQATPERYFRDYAYAAAVFYSNTDYQKEVINWCQEALVQAQLCKNSSGQQWVMAMLGSLYKKEGNLSKALELFQESIDDARSRNDQLSELNSLASLVDLFLYWSIPEYANAYASEAVSVEKQIKSKHPMVSAQVYINKGRALHQLGHTDSVSFYIEQARSFCESLPYNSGMVDVDLLNGICHTEKGGDSLSPGIQELERVTAQGTTATRAKAFHQLARIYLKHNKDKEAEVVLDSLYSILNRNESPTQILRLDYKPILDYYLKTRNYDKVEKYLGQMFHEREVFKDSELNYNLVEDIVELQTGSRLQELKIVQLRQANLRLLMQSCIAISLIVIIMIFTLLFKQRRKHKKQMRNADEQLASLLNKLNQSNVEKEKIALEVKEFLASKDNRQELETLTPYILKESGETKFRQCFELLYPLFLPRLREKVPTVSRREELLSMLIALKQDNKNIAELFAIAPRSVLMLRHRFRQKIGMNTDYSLENFIEDLLVDEHDSLS